MCARRSSSRPTWPDSSGQAPKARVRIYNYANFRPLAADRGLPADLSDPVRAKFDDLYSQHPDEVFGTTWISWAEVRAVDRDEPAEEPDSRLHCYQPTEDGLTYVGKSLWNRTFAEALDLLDPR